MANNMTRHWGIIFWHSLCALICYSLWVVFTGAGFGLGGWISSYVSEAILNDWGNAISYGTLALIIALAQILAVRLGRKFHQILTKLVLGSVYGNSLTASSLWSQGQRFWTQYHALSCDLVGYRGYISWLSTTILGGIVGGRLSILASWNLALTFDDGIDFLLIYGTLRGFMTGLLQAIVLRRHSVHRLKDRALWWAVITAGAGGISFRIGVSLMARLQIWTPSITGLIYGALTGLGCLIWVYGNRANLLAEDTDS